MGVGSFIMSGPAILAIDQGTTGTTVLVVDQSGSILGRAYAAVEQRYPQPGWVEHDAIQIWHTVQQAATQAIRDAGSPPLDSIGITNQRETTVLWDRRTGQPVGPAVVWQCRRTAARCEALMAAGKAEEIQDRTGLVLDAYFSGTKLEWLLDSVSGLRSRAENGEILFGTIDSWLVWQLTGGERHVTDVTNASRTLLLDIDTAAWSEQMLALLNVPAPVLPQIVPSSGVMGYTVATGEAIPAGVPIAGLAGDQQAALFGQACFTPGTAKTTYGTGCFLLLNTGTERIRSHHRLLSTIAWQLGPQAPLEYAMEGSVFVGGAVIQWLRDELGMVATTAETAAIASSVGDTGGVYLVPAFTGLGAPHWDPDARGTLVGLTRGTKRAHIVRAALEAIAYQVADVVDAMNRDSGSSLSEMRVDGGASANDFLMQFQADLLDCPILRPSNTETTAFGAAALAGLATGFWSSQEAIAHIHRIERRFEPAMTTTMRGDLRSGWQAAIERTRSRRQAG
jgi:glycerol kinase